MIDLSQEMGIFWYGFEKTIAIFKASILEFFNM